MRKLCIVLLGVSAFAADVPMPVSPTGARIVYVHEGDAPTAVNLRCKMEVTFEAPPGEKFIKGLLGDVDYWPHNEDMLPSRFFSVRPSFADLTTTLHLITDHDNAYAFVLKESRKTDPDITIILKSSDDAINKRIADKPTVISYDQYLAAKLEADQAKLDLKREVDEAKLNADRQVAAAQKALPAKVETYEFDRNEAEKYPWQIKEIFHDDRFTYIRRPGTASDLPTVYGTGANGKPEMIVAQYDPDQQIYVISRILHDGYLSFGHQKHEKKLAFHLPAKG